MWANFVSNFFLWAIFVGCEQFFCRRQQQDNCAGQSSFEPARHGTGNGFSSGRRVYSLIHNLRRIAGPSRCCQSMFLPQKCIIFMLRAYLSLILVSSTWIVISLPSYYRSWKNITVDLADTTVHRFHGFPFSHTNGWHTFDAKADAYSEQKLFRKTDWPVCFVKSPNIVLTAVLPSSSYKTEQLECNLSFLWCHEYEWKKEGVECCCV